jgi:hypothetical protein
MFSFVRSTKVGSRILTREVSAPHSLGYIDAVGDNGVTGGERLVQRHAQQNDTVVKGADEKVDLGITNAIYSSGKVSWPLFINPHLGAVDDYRGSDDILFFYFIR